MEKQFVSFVAWARCCLKYIFLCFQCLYLMSSAAGALMALFVGFSTILSNYAIGGVLLAFFISSCLLTRVSASMKRRIDAEFKEGGQRDWKQVACNGLVPTLIALAYGFHTAFVQGPFLGGCAFLLNAVTKPICGIYSSIFCDSVA